MKKHIFLILILLTSIGYGKCTDPVKSLLDISSTTIERSSSKFTCADLLYLEMKGQVGISYSEYIKLFPKGQNTKKFIELGVTPDKAKLIQPSTLHLFNQFKTKYKDVYSVVFEKGRFVIADSNTICSKKILPDLKKLPQGYQPAYFGGNQIFNAFQEPIGFVKPLAGGQTEIRIGTFRQKIDWNEACYSQSQMKAMMNAFSTCWLCPFYDLFFKAISKLSYAVWETLKKPMLIMVAILFPLLLLFQIFGSFYSFENVAEDFSIKKLLPQFLAISALTIIILPPEEYSIIDEFIELILEPIANFSVYLSEKFLPNQTCEYIPSSFGEGGHLFSATLKNDLLCLFEKLLGVFVDYVMVATVIILKAFNTLISWDAINVFNPVGIGQTVYTFIFTFLLGIGLVISFLRQMFRVLFYMVDPIFNMGMVFLYLPFTLLEWVLPGKDLKIKGESFSTLFKHMFNGFFVMIFTSLIVSICGAILLGLLATNETLSYVKDAITTGSFENIWQAVDLSKNMAPLRLIVGIIIIDTLMEKIPDYANEFASIEIDESAADVVRGKLSTVYAKGKAGLQAGRKWFKKIAGRMKGK